MTKQEASERYNIPIKILDEYESWGLCSIENKGMGAWQYDEQDLQRLSMIMTLHDIGFSNDEVQRYMYLLSCDNTQTERMQMLNKKRFSTLDEIHFKQTQLDRLDHIRFEILKAGENKTT